MSSTLLLIPALAVGVALEMLEIIRRIFVGPREVVANHPASTNPFLRNVRPKRQQRYLQALQRPQEGAVQHSFLLRLPAELRNIIYELTLVIDRPIHVYNNCTCDKLRLKKQSRPKSKGCPYCGKNKGLPSPALLRTCRRLRSDASSLYYGSNSFQCRGELETLCRWLKAIGPEQTTMIREIRLPQHLSRVLIGGVIPRPMLNIVFYKLLLEEAGVHLKHENVLHAWVYDQGILVLKTLSDLREDERKFVEQRAVWKARMMGNFLVYWHLRKN